MKKKEAQEERLVADTAEHSFTLDKVSERQMAELLGTTVRALQTRRARKQIPEGV